MVTFMFSFTFLSSVFHFENNTSVREKNATRHSHTPTRNESVHMERRGNRTLHHDTNWKIFWKHTKNKNKKERVTHKLVKVRLLSALENGQDDHICITETIYRLQSAGYNVIVTKCRSKTAVWVKAPDPPTPMKGTWKGFSSCEVVPCDNNLA